MTTPDAYPPDGHDRLRLVDGTPLGGGAVGPALADPDAPSADRPPATALVRTLLGLRLPRSDRDIA